LGTAGRGGSGTAAAAVRGRRRRSGRQRPCPTRPPGRPPSQRGRADRRRRAGSACEWVAGGGRPCQPLRRSARRLVPFAAAAVMRPVCRDRGGSSVRAGRSVGWWTAPRQAKPAARRWRWLDGGCPRETGYSPRPKFPHCKSSKSVPNRPPRERGGRFGTLLGQLECGIFGRTAVGRAASTGTSHQCGRPRNCEAASVRSWWRDQTPSIYRGTPRPHEGRRSKHDRPPATRSNHHPNKIAK